MKLKIDSRENSELTKQVLEKASELNIQTEKEWLDIGDYVFNDVCFEAKSSFDFLQSIVNNRLWNQMDNMDRAFDNNIVILYGTIEEAIQTHLSHSKSTMPKATQSVLLTKKFYGAMGKIIFN